MVKLERIPQKHRTGCGIACVSMLSLGRKTYDEVKEMIYPIAEYDYEADPTLYTDHRQLKNALDHLGIKRGENFKVCSNDWSVFKNKLNTYALVACGKRGDEWHWIVFDGERNLVFDPIESHPYPYVPDNRNRRPFSYLEIDLK